MGKLFAKIFLALLLQGITILPISAQKTASLNGYASGLYSPIYWTDEDVFLNNGLIHNRLNFKYTPNNLWSFTAEVRNRAIWGNFSNLSPDYFSLLTGDNGWMNLSWNILQENSFVLNSSIERLNIAFSDKKWSFVVGRQRINWSQTLMFNPNDIFNAYSFFDFDYPEKAGSDAVRLSYYPSPVSVVEVAAKLNRWGQSTVAVFYRFNRNGWDMQVLGGIVNQYDRVIGAGFSGEASGVNLRGEASFFHSTQTGASLKNTLVTSLGADYTFKNSLMLSGTVLYNQQALGSSGNFLLLYQTPITPRQLSITDWTACVQASYSFTPLLTGGLAVVSFVNLPAFYLGPSVDYSLSNNLTFSAMIQFFADASTTSLSNLALGYLRLKYNF
ncbi:MAG: hypothetical protein FWF52_09620 [Candidatus Azobacteroides sp.]|nr:hypothetical protein [Candidatus Azobacteroides sp.]